VLGPSRVGLVPELGLTGFGGAGGVDPPPSPDGAAGDKSSYAGSSSSRDLGGFSTVELRLVPALGRALLVGGPTAESDTGGLPRGGTELTVPFAGSSVVTGALGPQLVQGAATGAGLV
jgi:hypothetical protein